MIKTKLYQGIATLTMDRFIRCIVDKDLSALIESKGLIDATPEELEERWALIYEEYAERMDDDSIKTYVVLMAQKIQLQTRVYITSQLVETCAKRYNEEALKVFRALGYDFTFSQKTWEKDLIKVAKNIKYLSSQVKNLDKELAPYLKEQTIKREDFIDALVLIGKHVGYALRPEETTVESYIVHLNNLKRWQETQRKLQK